MVNRSLYAIIGFCISLTILYAGCKKEYSYEGGNPPIIDTIPVPGPGNDPGQAPNPVRWTCPDCIGRDFIIESKWSFHYDSTLICGIIDTAIGTPDRTGFTFFGPSACSIDTSMIIQVLMDNPLDKDQYQVNSQQITFFYRDNVGQTFIATGSRASRFNLTIYSYTHQTKTITGSFGGTVVKANGDSSYISSGKFRVKLL